MPNDRVLPSSEAALRPYMLAIKAAIRTYDLAEAERQCRAALAVARSLDPPDPIAVAHLLTSLSSLPHLTAMTARLGQRTATPAAVLPEEAEAARLEALALMETHAGPESSELAKFLYADATTLRMAGRAAEAEEATARAEAIVAARPTADPVANLAAMMQRSFGATLGAGSGPTDDELEAAVDACRAAVEEEAKAGLPPSLFHGSARSGFGGALMALAMRQYGAGRYRHAEASAREAISLREGDLEMSSGPAWSIMADALLAQWKLREAWRAYRRGRALDRERWAGADWSIRWTMAGAGLLAFFLKPFMRRSINATINRPNREELP
ncbi:MAG TPA: hypothetical protein VGM37_21105 [Armatimonadota bacterium]|jgi:tetratricopeptide (TPR) repeat protein